MKKQLLSIFLLFSMAGYCQTNNSWIDYNKTYYKFKVGATGLYRIPQATLASIGLGNTPAEQFQIWRNGEEVRIYTTSATGALGTSGYIEFWGVMNDGKKDTKLYLNTDYQLSDRFSLVTDTAAYFLTVNAAGNNLRFTNAANNVAGTTLTAEPYFINTKGVHYRDKLNPGYAAVVGEYVHSSSYDIGEGWSSSDIGAGPGFALFQLIDSLNIYPAGPPASLRIAAAGNALNSRNVKVKISNTVVVDTAMDYFGYLKKQVNNIPLSAFPNPDNILISIENTATIADRMVVSFVEITYPAKFNFNNSRNFYFELPATTTGNYLVIDNFNTGGIAPVLFDITSGNRYTGDISTAGKVKFVLPPSTLALRKFVLANQEVSNINNVLSVVQRNFVNYSIAANQGNYLIISHPSLYNNGSGKNYVDEYRAYRSSAAGGGFNTKIYDIDQLNDQFGYGIKNHPSSVKDFLQFVKSNFAQLPKFVFLIGKGVSYSDYLYGKSWPTADRLNLVPTFGFPASDIRLASGYNSLVPDISIGRLSVVNGNEVGNYLVKMKQYEQAQVSTSQTVADKGWMKNVIHLIGGKDVNESDLFKLYMRSYKDIIEDTFYGAKVETFSKISTAAVQLISNRRIDELLNQGVNLVSYFGHSSANTLEFNLNAPEAYNNFGKYPFFNVSGCTAGNNYTADTLRLHGNMSLSEKYVLANQRGSIAFLASTHLGLPPFLNNYQTELYKEMSQTNYGSPAGDIIKKVIQNLGGANPALDFFTRMNLEEMTLHGDPALKINPHPKPDYVIEDNMVKVSPAFISVAENNFTVNINMLNIGKAKKDSIVLEIKHIYPSGGSQVIYRKKMNAFYYADSVKLTFPIIATRDKGLNKLVITIDADNAVDEMSESNNTINKDFYIFEDEARPAYPYNFAIINVQNQKLYASTANPFSPAKPYTMEIDTTELFNSTLKVSKTITAAGGILEFDPGFNYTDSTVYYWRVAVQPASGSAFRWNTFSFIYLKNGLLGFNQSQYYQHLKSDTLSITLTANRKWKYSTVLNTLFANNGVFPTAANTADDFTVKVNGADITRSACAISTILINVFDPVSLKPWKNVFGGSEGLYGSDPVCINDLRIYNFQYNILDVNKRKKALDFLDMIPDSALVVVRNVSGTNMSSNTYASDWLADTATFGSGNSLYHRLKSQGFAQVDSFNRPRAFIFMYQKNITGFTPKWIFSEGILDKINISTGYSTPDTLGIITSPKFGPAKAWKQLHWGGSSEEANSRDNPIIDVIGIDYNNNATTLLSVNINSQDVDISGINAGAYPFLQLKMRNMDSVTLTPYQLSFWRVNYDPAPEGAVAPNLFFISKDTLQLGDKLKFGIAFKNISPQAFDSLQVKVIVIDRNNTSHIITVPKQKPLVAGDTVTLKFDIDTNGYEGSNTLYVDFNPDNNQPEQFHFNNFLYKDFFVNSDKTNPLLDVTFDGIHILNRDIVSARPHILIKLKDESKTLALIDTSLLKVQIRFPDGTLRTYKVDNDTLKFTPANLANGENTATLDFTPLLNGQDDEYELIVSGKDASGNRAGETDFHVIFRVINKPMISNLLNYPNPFTTSTAFVFTVTGTQPPQNMRIQILTITGKVVREITSNELGPIRIGRNITEFKWDGTDMYGQKLANGVYLYRVLTNLNGKSLDKFKDQDDNTDKYFTNGYGKMYFLNSTKY